MVFACISEGEFPVPSSGGPPSGFQYMHPPSQGLGGTGDLPQFGP